MHRQRQGRTAESLGQGILPVGVGDGRRIGGQEGGAVFVEQAVQHNAQRVDVHRAAVGFALIDLRGHVGIRTLLGQAAAGLFHRAGNTEISQLEVAALRDKHVLRLYIPVDDIELLAKFQRLTHIDANLDDILPGDGMLPGVVVQRGQQLHLNENVPAYAIFVLNDLVVLIADDIAVALEFAHQGKFPYQVPHEGAEVLPHACFVHAVCHGTAQLRLVGRDCNGLQRRFVGNTKVLSPNLEDLSEAALADQAVDIPGAKMGSYFL